MSRHWTEKLFIEESHLFGAALEKRLEITDTEIEGLLTIFDEHKVPENGFILDLACGIGRHSVPLAKKGYNLVGIDISSPYIKKARKYAEEQRVSEKTHFTVGDMRQITKTLTDHNNVFDAVINLWTSMGYWDEETDRNILSQALTLTKPRGIFIMQTVNRDFLIKNFQARDIVFGKEGLVVFEERKLDLESSRMFNVWRYYRQSGEDLLFISKMEVDHRIYSFHELKKQFEDSDWEPIASYGDFDQKPLSTDTFSMILVAEKP
jgi:SAM-dependent methyltransferase